MNGNVIAALIASVGMALVITALTLPGRQSAAVISATGLAGAHLEEAALGMRP